MLLKDLFAIFPDETRVRIIQSTIFEPVRSTSLLLSKMLSEHVLYAKVLRVEAVCEDNNPILEVLIEDTFTLPEGQNVW